MVTDNKTGRKHYRLIIGNKPTDYMIIKAKINPTILNVLISMENNGKSKGVINVAVKQQSHKFKFENESLLVASLIFCKLRNC